MPRLYLRNRFRDSLIVKKFGMLYQQFALNEEHQH